MEERLNAWNTAEVLVGRIVDQHGLEVTRSGTNPFGPYSTFSKVDQHIDHLIRVSNWLLKEE